MNNVLIVPNKGRRVVTDELKKSFHRESYSLGLHDGIRDCIHYLRQQGYVVEEYDQDKHG